MKHTTSPARDVEIALAAGIVLLELSQVKKDEPGPFRGDPPGGEETTPSMLRCYAQKHTPRLIGRDEEFPLDTDELYIDIGGEG